jgi:hypothetical protein
MTSTYANPFTASTFGQPAGSLGTTLCKLSEPRLRDLFNLLSIVPDAHKYVCVDDGATTNIYFTRAQLSVLANLMNRGLCRITDPTANGVEVRCLPDNAPDLTGLTSVKPWSMSANGRWVMLYGFTSQPRQVKFLLYDMDGWVSF